MARPMPREEPVTTATLPCNRFAVLGAPSKSTSVSLSMACLRRRTICTLDGRRKRRTASIVRAPRRKQRKRMVDYTHVRTAVIVATYDQPRWLELALRAWARQERPPDRVVVADDGSGPDTAVVVRRFGAAHGRREREAGRFGKCGAVNAAVRRARELGCDFALFTDGDCLPAGGLLARHVQVAQRGRFAAGGVVRLSRQASEALTAE